MGELRIRNVPKQLTDKFKKVEQHFKVVESTKAIEMLIHQFFEDQDTIKRMKQDNQLLLGTINRYQGKEQIVKNIIAASIGTQAAAIRDGQSFIRDMQKIVKQFGTNKRKKVPAGKRSRKQRK